MSTISVRLAESLHRRVKEIAKREGISINQFITTAVAEKISALMTEEYVTSRASRATPGALRGILDRVPDREPLPGDEA